MKRVDYDIGRRRTGTEFSNGKGSLSNCKGS
jgi:hypothetical protein